MHQNSLIDKIKFFFKNIFVNLIVFIFYTQFYFLAHASDCIKIPMISDFSYVDQSIYVQSDELDIYYPKKILFSGHVNIKQDNHILMSDKLVISRNEKNELLYNTLYAYGHVKYYSDYIELTGTHAWMNCYNKDIDIHKGTYYLLEPHIYGVANSIMQRGKNRYTIVKQGKCTSCILNDSYWNITGSEMIYDHHKRNIDIWNACLKIKKIPIFYTPYLSLSLRQNNILRHYIPSIRYNNKQGLGFKIPCPINFSKHYSGSIVPCYTSNLGAKLETEIRYLVKPGTGLLILDIVGNDKIRHEKFDNDYRNSNWQLYWKHNGIMNKKWHFYSNYLLTTGFNNYSNNTNVPAYIHPNNDYINQKILCNYSDKNWNTSFTYFGVENAKITMIQDHYNYRAAPRIELNTYYSNIKGKPFNLKLFSQLTQFIPENYNLPKTIRIHIEPTLTLPIHNCWSRFNTEAKLRITNYRQKNINYYNKILYMNYPLQNTVNRLIPQFKINGKIILKKKTYVSKKYRSFLEPKFQYLYIPYRFQENIGIYDTNMIHIDHKNLFHDSICSGLDRILPANQIAGDITIRCFKKKNEFFYASIGQILNLAQFNTKYPKTTKYRFHVPNIKLFSGASRWNINNYWNTSTEIQYDMQHHTLSFGTIILEYIGKDNQVLQTHYRYINEQHLEKILPKINESTYYKTISQLGILTCYPLFNNWRISCSHYHNIKTNQFIDQTIGIQYHTPCWGVNISYERKIIDWINLSNRHTYDNKIRLDIKIYNSVSDFQQHLHKMLNIGILPYQYIS
ncbi:LPS assembly protein LptD [Candidatus Blochmannia vicinus]|uniref:LPS-assembly protein LptD n=1 Tax=Candidatus Blochmannia vicinus (nom. nud.) TaxID=251540 RepID=A0ABY4SX34_9ENTR|nr:LPS assembly protein LptD [Candidatus Blochmannia vicinus]URJ32823.1 LPS assembly protein LptD [Candidatus Blochmannia vicinus]